MAVSLGLSLLPYKPWEMMTQGRPEPVGRWSAPTMVSSPQSTLISERSSGLGPFCLGGAVAGVKYTGVRTTEHVVIRRGGGMAETDPVRQERFILRSEGLDLRVFAAVPANEEVASPCVQIHHGGGGFDPLYEQMAQQLARHGFLGVALIHRGYPGSEGCQQYGKGE